MPSPALGSFLRSYSGLALAKQEKEEQQGRSDFNQYLNILLRAGEDPSVTEAGREHIGGLLRDHFKSISGKGKYKNLDIVGLGEGLAGLYDTRIPEQRTAAGQAPSVSQPIPEGEQGIGQLINSLTQGDVRVPEPSGEGGGTYSNLGGGDFLGGEREITSDVGGGALVSEASNPFRRSREDMLSEGIDIKLKRIQEAVDQGLIDPETAGILRAQSITGMQVPQQRAQSRDPLMRTYKEGEGYTFTPASQAAGMGAGPGPREEGPSTPTGQYQADRVEFWTRQGFDPVEAQKNAVRDDAEREERRKVNERLDRELKESLLATRQASEAGRPIDRAGLANSMVQNAQRQAANLVKDYIEQLQNATDPEAIQQGDALAADPEAQDELREQFFNEILAAHGVQGSDLRSILGGVTGEAAAEQTIGTIGRRLLGQ